MSRIQREFSARRGRQILITALFMIPVVVVAILRRNQPGPVTSLMGVSIRWWLIAFFVVALVAVVASQLNWRCPACGSPLSRRLNHEFCPKCGAALFYRPRGQ